MVKDLNLQDEIRALSFLDKSLDHFSDALLCIRENPSEAQKNFSNSRVVKVLENISIQYLYRGIEYKDVEAMNLLWNFILIDETDCPTVLFYAALLIDVHSDLLDDSGNRMRLSKKIGGVDMLDVIEKSQKTFESELTDFENLEDYDKFYVLFYLLSMWHYNALKGLKKGSKKWYNEFDRLWKMSNLSEKPAYFHTLTSKLLLSAVQINVIMFKQSANNILYDAVRNIMKIKSLPSYLVTIYHRTFRRLVLTTINYSINRMTDLDQYGKLMITCKANAITSGFFFRTAEYISLAILRHLNMEKLEFAMVRTFFTLLFKSI
jgi:hypothetical protein